MRSFLDRFLRLFGYAPPPQGCREMNRLEWAVCKAVAEMMWPEKIESWPSYRDADALQEIDDFLGGAIPRQRRLIACLFWFTELWPLLRPPFRRFTRLPVPARQGLLDRWDRGRIFFFNLCASSLRMLFNLAYLSHEKVKQRIGEAPRPDCREPVAPRRLKRRGDGSFEGILEFPALQGKTIREEADFVVVGSGPGGAVAARELAEAGRSVIVLEEGPFHRPEEHGSHAMRTLKALYCEQGLRHTRGNTPVRTMQARALGGTSLVNSAIYWRAPQWLFDKWRDQFGVEGLSRQALDPHYERAERNASVAPTEEAVWGRKGLLFRAGCLGVGVESRPINRATPGCRGCSECFYGCHINAKQSMDRCYIPAAIERGARFYTSCRAEELIIENGRVAGVRARVLEPARRAAAGRVEVRAKATILAAGVMASPLLLLKNDLPGRSPAVGRNLCFHNGIAVSGVFEKEVNPWVGATQGCDTEAYIPEGIHMEVLWGNSAVLTARARGFGQPLRELISELSRSAFWCISIRGSSRGTLSAGRDWEPRLRFDLIESDVRMLKRGLDLLVDHFFAAGAVKVRPGLAGFLTKIHTPAQVEELKRLRARAQDFMVGGNHAFGTCAMGADPRTSVVDSHCAVHNAADLYLCDTSIFPTQSAVNPQLTLMAMSSRLAETLNARY